MNVRRSASAKLRAFVAGSLLGSCLFLQLGVRVVGQLLPEFDFTRPATAREWGQAHHISALHPTAAGLEILIDGNDPYFFGPARDYPPD